jgi:hypothetical protein
MSRHNRAYLIICALVGFGLVGAEPMQALSLLSKDSDVPIPRPKSQELLPVHSVTVTNGEVIIGRIAVYDDPTTARSADVAALYDPADGLVAIGWFDRFGIERIAIDNGIVKQTGKLEGLLVVIVRGEPL